MRYEVKLKFQEFFLGGSNTECVSGLEPYNHNHKDIVMSEITTLTAVSLLFRQCFKPQSVCIQLRAGSRL